MASEPEAEDKPQEPAVGEIPANLLLTFNGSWDKVRLDVYVSHKRAIVQLDEFIRRLELWPGYFIYYSCSVRWKEMWYYIHTDLFCSKCLVQYVCVCVHGWFGKWVCVGASFGSMQCPPRTMKDILLVLRNGNTWVTNWEPLCYIAEKKLILSHKF